MNLIIVLVIILYLRDVQAQDTTNPQVHNPLHPSLAAVIGILTVMFSLTCLILAYVKFCNRYVPVDQNLPQVLLRSRSRFSGIDKKVIESLPFFRFSSLGGSKEGLECVICLSKFEDSEILRLLPKCRHAFHLNCIDKWLESHSSCPLCRYKFDAGELTNFSCTNSLRYPQNSLNLTEGPNLELFIQREQEHLHWSSRFNLGSSFHNFSKSKKKDLLIQEAGNDEDRKLMDKFKHRIILSDIVYKSRWSNVNSSDLMLLNSEMLNVMSSKRFSPLLTDSGRFHAGISVNEHVVKIKDDMERKRLYESKVSNVARTKSASGSSFASTSNTEAGLSTTSRSLNPAEKRSMSEITNVSRFTEYSKGHRMKEALHNGRDERLRRLWLPIAKRTVQWFAGRERGSPESESKRISPNYCNITVPNFLTINQTHQGPIRSLSTRSGIDKEVIEMLPFFRFSSLKGSKEGLDCAICLSKFYEDEYLRSMPNCRHVFHINCIDGWLEYHSSCPLCRYKFDVREFASFTYKNSLGDHSPQNPSYLTEKTSIELRAETEQKEQFNVTMFNLGGSFRKLGKRKTEHPLIQEDDSFSDDNSKLLACKRRRSDVEYSGLNSLNSEMLNVLSRERFHLFHPQLMSPCLRKA
ncbi:hypothetical protein RJ639_008631 [Escallonia herrerae]|uniref:RING-type E3 ubiquitin transferase n=1 Tax=Escallonia herrerae TaxID=1293975 RepID=A0AA89ASQ2_9ASTE|nr:hypothetical protein RJ639_008631 [Escallonia herrerae]